MRRAPPFPSLLTVCLLLGAGLPAQGPVGDAWRLESFLDESGLVGRGLFDLDFETDGTLWLAASDGLYRFDGYAWMRYGREHGLPSENVRSVCMTRSGVLWVGTDKGAGIFRRGRFENGVTTGDLAGPSVRRIVEDREGVLWFCCDRWPDRLVAAGLTRFDGTTWRSYGTADGLPSDYVSDCYQARDGSLFVLTRAGLARREGERFVRPLEEAGLADAKTYVWSLVESPRHGLLAGTSEAFFVRQQGAWRRIANGPRRIMQPKLAATSDGEILACSSGDRLGFRAFDGERFRTVVGTGRWTSGTVQRVREAPDGSVWAVGSGVLARWLRRHGEWSLLQGLPSPCVHDHRGGVWFADSENVTRLLAGERERFEGCTGPVAADLEKGVWMSQGASVVRWYAGRTTRVDVSAALGTRPRQIVCDGQGVLWLLGLGAGGRGRLAMVREGRAEAVPLESAGRAGRVTGMVPLPECGVLLVQEEANRDLYGAIRVTPDGVASLALPEDARRLSPPRLLATADGCVWAYGFFGLRVLRPEAQEWERISLPGNTIAGIAERGACLWVSFRGDTGGGGGVARLCGAETRIYPALAGKLLPALSHDPLVLGGPRRLFVLGRDGEPRRLTLPMRATTRRAVHDGGADLWIGTDLGVLHYSPDGVPPDTHASVLPDSVHTGETVQLRVHGVERFKSASRRSTFDVAMRADGGAWTAWQPLLGDELLHSFDAPGEHVIEVRVRDEGGDVDPTPAVLRVRVDPPPLQSRAWFWPAVMSAVLLLLTLVVVAVLGWRRTSGVAGGLEEAVRSRTRELQSSEWKYRSLFEESRDAILLFDTEGILRDWNRTARELLHRADAREGALQFEDLVAEQADAKAIRGQLERQGAVRSKMSRIVGAHGRQFNALVTANVRRDEHGSSLGFQVILRDVSQQVALEERLRLAEKMEALGRMAGGVAHDFNNILTAILGYADVVAEEVDGALAEDVDSLRQAALRGQGITSQIRAFSRTSAGRGPVADARAQLLDLEDRLRQLLPDSVDVDLEAGVQELPVRIEPHSFEQVVMNLAVNAAQAMPDGGRLTVRAAREACDPAVAELLGVGEGSPCVVLALRDEGTGMSADVLKRIFDPFFTTKPPGEGTGLGLAIVYGIVRQCGGHIQVESRPGGGSTFTTRLPLASGSPQRSAPAGEESGSEAGGQETILLAEDEPGIRDLVRRSLQNAGYSVIAAGNGREALDLLARDPSAVNLLIADVVMPEMGGIELVRRAEELRPDLPALMISGYPRADSDGAGMDAIDRPLLEKPFRGAELRRRVRSLLDRHAADRAGA